MSLGPLFLILKGVGSLNDGMLGFRCDFFPLIKIRGHLILDFEEKNFSKDLSSQKVYSRNYFKHNFVFLGPSVSILQRFE